MQVGRINAGFRLGRFVADRFVVGLLRCRLLIFRIDVGAETSNLANLRNRRSCKEKRDCDNDSADNHCNPIKLKKHGALKRPVLMECTRPV